MSLEIIYNDKKYKKLVETQIEELLTYLIKNEIRFNIVVNIAPVTFIPKLTDAIIDKFKPITLFAISGYTFDTATIYKNMFIFQAGFGPANFASEVRVPLFSIMQIVIEESVIYINLLAGNDKYIKEHLNKKSDERSLNNFINNPKNKELISKLKNDNN